jgi:hypothetical protein
VIVSNARAATGRPWEILDLGETGFGPLDTAKESEADSAQLDEGALDGSTVGAGNGTDDVAQGPERSDELVFP